MTHIENLIELERDEKGWRRYLGDAAYENRLSIYRRKAMDEFQRS